MPDFPETDIERPEPQSRRRWWLIGGATALLAVGLVGFAVWWFVFRSDAPPPATIEGAVDALTSSTTSGPPGETTEPSTSTTSPVVALDGIWTVDTAIGSFDDFTNSWVGYRIQEELEPIGSNTAAGRTPVVSGTLSLSGTTIEAVAIEADMQALVSDMSTRDDQLRGRGLETDTFPTATFTLTEPIVLDAIPSEGVTITVDAVGDLMLHGVTNSVTLAVDAQLVGDVIAVVASTEIALADYDIDPPTGFRVLSIADIGEMELQLFFTGE